VIPELGTTPEGGARGRRPAQPGGEVLGSFWIRHPRRAATLAFGGTTPRSAMTPGSRPYPRCPRRSSRMAFSRNLKLPSLAIGLEITEQPQADLGDQVPEGALLRDGEFIDGADVLARRYRRMSLRDRICI
jgi:hypothetical protein